jgi:hypothetical protein
VSWGEEEVKGREDEVISEEEEQRSKELRRL